MGNATETTATKSQAKAHADAPRCPFVDGVAFDPMEHSQILDPHPWLKAAREESPVFYMDEYDEWWVTRYEDVLAIVKDTKRFSSKHVVVPKAMPGMEEAYPEGHPLAGGLINTDPPEHNRLRKVAQKAFTPGVIAPHEPAIRAYANSLIDGFIADGKVNFTDRYTRLLAGGAITIATGADSEKGDEFIRANDYVLKSSVEAPPMPPEEQQEVIDGLRSFFEWLDGFIEERRENPKDDLCSILVHAKAEDGSPTLSNWEIVRVLTNILTAGIDTTSALISMTMFNLLRERERWERLQREPELIPDVLDEVLRYAHPVRGLRRDVLEDVELGGVQLKKGTTLTVNYASAHRDQEVFGDADSFDIDRKDISKSFAFGKGTHFCIGKPLALMEARISLELLLERIPDIRLPEGEFPKVVPTRLAAFVTDLNLEWPTAR